MFREPNYLSTDPNPRLFIWSGNLIIYPLIIIPEYLYVQGPNYISTDPNPRIFIC